MITIGIMKNDVNTDPPPGSLSSNIAISNPTIKLPATWNKTYNRVSCNEV
jgi:hypothetical protein